MVVKHLNPKCVCVERGGLLCWLSTMRPHVEDMFIPLQVRIGGSRREGRRQRGGGISEREADMMTKVYIVRRKRRGGIQRGG